LTTYFLSSKDAWKIIDKTYYSYDSELTCEEMNSLVSFVNVVLTFENIFGAGQNYSGYVPLVHELNGGNIRANIMVRFFTIVSVVHLFHTFF
jgi:hypothetical protein